MSTIEASKTTFKMCHRMRQKLASVFASEEQIPTAMKLALLRIHYCYEHLEGKKVLAAGPVIGSSICKLVHVHFRTSAMLF
jgi:hypothetical protein